MDVASVYKRRIRQALYRSIPSLVKNVSLGWGRKTSGTLSLPSPAIHHVTVWRWLLDKHRLARLADSRQALRHTPRYAQALDVRRAVKKSAYNNGS